MTDKYFLDTNILVYAYDADNKKKSAISRELILEGIRSDNAVISIQVLSEFFVTVTQKVKKTILPQKARAEMDLLKSLEVMEMDYPLVLSAVDIHIKNRISYWDALIVASAQRTKCACIYSEDLNHGQVFNGVKVLNPYH